MPPQPLKLLVNKPQYLTFLSKEWIRLLTRFLEVPYQGGSPETLSYLAQKSQILRFIYQKLELQIDKKKPMERCMIVLI